MNILLVTNNLYPTGGDWTYVDSVAKLYKQHGHNVYLWGRKNEKNLDKTFEDYNVDALDLNKRNKLLSSYNLLKGSIYSIDAERQMKRFLDDFKIDIVQLNSINIGLTPSIINPIYKAGIPIVWRIIDYKPLCPNIYMMRGDVVCEECKGHHYFNCIKNKCKNNSLKDSIAVALETYVYSKRKEYTYVDLVSFQNQFTFRLYREWDFPIKEAVVEINPYDASLVTPCYKPGDYVLFFGRYVRPKGVLTILKSAKINKDINYVFVGKGDLEEEMRFFLEKEGLTNVSILGPAWGEEMDSIIKKSRIVISASEWYEPSSYVALQAFANGKPVVASNMGGVPEIVINNYSGMLFKAGDVVELAKVTKELYENPQKVEDMGRNARKELEEEYSPDKYYQRTIELFERLIIKKKNENWEGADSKATS